MRRVTVGLLLLLPVACDEDSAVADSAGASTGVDTTTTGDGPADSSSDTGGASTGQGSEDTGTQGSACAENEFVEDQGCSPCPEGTSSPGGDDPLGGATSCDPMLCSPDELVEDNACAPCPPGTKNEGGDDASQGDTACDAILCGADEFVEAWACVPCPRGTSNRAGDSAAARDTSCDAELCVENENVESGACEACPPGTENAAGDDPSGRDTACGAVFCDADEFVQRHVCVPCLDGEVNEAGDDASSRDTTCVALCDVDESVEVNACVPCAPGTTNEGGDDPTGDETECSTVFCGADEFVEDNECEACPFGAVSDPGADASGPDTSCIDGCLAAFGLSCDDFEDAYLKAPDASPADEFGGAVALSGDTLAVGTLQGETVYVFRRVGPSWMLEAQLQASNSEVGDRFGEAVTLSGDTLVVGARHEDSGAVGPGGDETNNDVPSSGAVYVFRRAGSDWSQEAYLKASNPDVNDQFGDSVSISGDALVVGAWLESSDANGVDGDQDNDFANGSGAAYVFRRTGGTWAQEAYLKPSNTGSNDWFGDVVAVSGDTVIVGAQREDSAASGVDGDGTNNSAFSSGAAYIFRRNGLSWSQDAYLKASNADNGALFGAAVAVSGDTVVVGAYLEASEVFNSGAVYVFRDGAGGWEEEAYIKSSNPGAFDHFGNSVAIEGDVMVVGAPSEWSNATGVAGNQANNLAPSAGAVYFFRRATSVWTQDSYIKASNTEEDDGFGIVALSGPLLAVGAPYEDSDAVGVDGDQSDNSSEDSGAVYLRRIAP